MDDYYIYVCYPIVKRDDKKETYIVGWGTEMESFRNMRKAVRYCKEHYAQYLIAVEKCDHEVYSKIE